MIRKRHQLSFLKNHSISQIRSKSAMIEKNFDVSFISDIMLVSNKDNVNFYTEIEYLTTDRSVFDFNEITITQHSELVVEDWPTVYAHSYGINRITSLSLYHQLNDENEVFQQNNILISQEDQSEVLLKPIGSIPMVLLITGKNLAKEYLPEFLGIKVF